MKITNDISCQERVDDENEFETCWKEVERLVVTYGDSIVQHCLNEIIEIHNKGEK